MYKLIGNCKFVYINVLIMLEYNIYFQNSWGDLMNNNDIVFALDIGTRTVIGVVGVQEENVFKILAAEITEHKNRAMMDGQVHDIDKVAEAAFDVKHKLEEKLGIKLKKVAIAAAGRVLKTKQVKVETLVSPETEITKEIVSSLEMEGIQLAQMQLDEELGGNEKVSYYCVGYSVVNYYLNSYVISSLAGHKGKTIGADILATFLPHMVVDSLYTVMNKIGLEVSNLTLEPIAAINVAIPKDLRLLNLALVDIGAGTSDIALTKDGTVIGYAMVPVAGDEITEAICHTYLVDFNTAEKIKTSLNTSKSDIKFADILGNKKSFKIKEILDSIDSQIEHLAKTISDKILEYNGKAPNAVFLIGGGSQVAGLDKKIAGYLGIQEERVGVRKRDAIQNIKISGKKLSGPDSITPIGIAVTAELQKGHNFLNVTINGSNIRLFNSRRLYVADALVLLGYKPSQLIGKNGKNLGFVLNGESKTILGEICKASELLVNGKPSNLQTAIDNGDNITVKPAVNGENASINIAELRKKYANEEALITINDETKEESYSICEGDVIVIKYKEQEDEAHEAEVRNETEVYEEVPAENEFSKDEETKPIKEISTKPLFEELEAVASEEPAEETITVKVNDTDIVMSGSKKGYIFVDIFNFYDFDVSRPYGKLHMTLNGVSASFTSRLKDGDVIEVRWEK